MKLSWADCRIDTDSRTLERRGRPVRVQALAFDLLTVLLRNRGRLVSDAHLRERLWPGVSVSDASLRQVLKQARRAIGDDGRTQAVIETIRGRGLRFVAPVNESGNAALFSGREDLIARFERELDETEAGAGGLTLLAGPAGIGKSGTLAEIAARAEARSWRVFEAWACAGNEADAYAVWNPIAEAIGASIQTAAAREVPPTGGISDAHRFERFRALQAALHREASVCPALLCLDDLHFADRESLATASLPGAGAARDAAADPRRLPPDRRRRRHACS